MESPYRIRDWFTALLISLVGILLIAAISGGNNSPQWLVISLVVQQVGLLCGVGVVIRQRGPLSVRPISIRRGLVLAIGANIVMFAIGALISLIATVEQTAFKPLVGTDAWTSMVGVWAGVIGAPIAEELFFRGLLLGALTMFLTHRQWRHPWLMAALVSSVVFGLLHYEGGSVLIPLQLTIFGLVACALARQSIALAIVFHVINNTLVFAHSFGDPVIAYVSGITTVVAVLIYAQGTSVPTGVPSGTDAIVPDET